MRISDWSSDVCSSDLGRGINVYDTHLHWTEGGGAIRAEQVADALRYIAATDDGLPSVLAGDLNASMDAPELQPLLGPFLDAYAALRSDERRVGKECASPCRSRWSPYH